MKQYNYIHESFSDAALYSILNGIGGMTGGGIGGLYLNYKK